MSSDTPNAQRIKRASLMTEKGTVERAIEIEDRMEEIERKIRYFEYLMFEYGSWGIAKEWITECIDDMQSELSDLQREYRG